MVTAIAVVGVAGYDMGVGGGGGMSEFYFTRVAIGYSGAVRLAMTTPPDAPMV